MYENHSVGNNVLGIIKTGLFAAVLSLVGVLVLTLLMSFLPFSDGVLVAVSRLWKAIAIATGCALFIKGEKGWLKGAIAGLLSTMLSYLVLAPFGGAGLSVGVLLEMLFGVSVGIVGGIIAVNLRR